MIPVDVLVELLRQQNRSDGARTLASFCGASRLCLFIRDPELNCFLPSPGFPQLFPSGWEWKAFLDHITEHSQGSRELLSPFDQERVPVSGFLLSDNVLVALFGKSIRPDAREILTPALKVLGALLCQEVNTRLANAKLSQAISNASESRQLTQALSEAHDKLSAALQAREALTEQLRRQEERLHLAHRLSGIGIWDLDPAKGTVHVLPAACEIFGLGLSIFDGPFDAVLSRIYSADRDHVTETIASMSVGESDRNLQFRVTRPDGSFRWIESRVSFLRSADGNPASLVVLSLDVTQRVLTEETLIRSEKLAAAGRLSASIAHEINNPLEALVNLIYLARGESDVKEIHALIATAEEELRRVSAVTRQTLRFYRDTNFPSRFGVAKVLDEALDVLSKQLSKRGLILYRKIRAVPDIEGWPGEIIQAVTNLVLNAADASENGSSIYVRLCSHADRLHLLVADHGHGIPLEQLNRIFEPFFSTRRESGTGLGLGLWITQQIVLKHRGKIKVRSKIGSGKHGTIFQINLPAFRSTEPLVTKENSQSYRWIDFAIPGGSEV